MNLDGTVNSDLQPIVDLELVAGIAREEFPFVVDTGFNQELSIDMGVVDKLGVVKHDLTRVLKLANGKTQAFPIVFMCVDWNDKDLPLQVPIMGMNLLGMQLCKGHHLSVDISPGGVVALRS